MDVRELSPGEWTKFVDCFSRRFRGQPMTLRVAESEGRGERLLAARLPLLGITAESAEGQLKVIEVMLGDSTVQNVVHIVRHPAHVRVAQITAGQDEQLVIEETTGETARIDLR